MAMGEFPSQYKDFEVQDDPHSRFQTHIGNKKRGKITENGHLPNRECHADGYFFCNE